MTFLTAWLALIKSSGTDTDLSVSNLSTLPFKLFKPVGSFSNFAISNLSTSDFKLAKSTFLAKFDVPTPVTFSKSAFVA